MRQHTTTVLCLLIAAASLSFAAGQTVGQDRAEADAKTSRVQFVRDSRVFSELRLLFRAQVLAVEELRDIEEIARKTCLNVRLLNTPTPGTGSSEFVCPSVP